MRRTLIFVWTFIAALLLLNSATAEDLAKVPAPVPTVAVKPSITIPDPLQLRLQRALNRKLLADRELDRILQQARRENPAFKEADLAMEDLMKLEQEVRREAKIPKECMLRLSGDWECPAVSSTPATKPVSPNSSTNSTTK